MNEAEKNRMKICADELTQKFIEGFGPVRGRHEAIAILAYIKGSPELVSEFRFNHLQFYEKTVICVKNRLRIGQDYFLNPRAKRAGRGREAQDVFEKHPGEEKPVKRYTPTVQFMAEAYCQLFARNGITVSRGVVFNGDTFELDKSQLSIRHPIPHGATGGKSFANVMGVYAVARNSSGVIIDIEWADREQIELWQNEYGSYGGKKNSSSLWWSKPIQMAQKSLITQRLRKSLPTGEATSDVQDFIDQDIDISPEIHDISDAEIDQIMQNDSPQTQPQTQTPPQSPPTESEYKLEGDGGNYDIF